MFRRKSRFCNYYNQVWQMAQNTALCGWSQIKWSAKKKNFIIYTEESLDCSDCV